MIRDMQACVKKGINHGGCRYACPLGTNVPSLGVCVGWRLTRRNARDYALCTVYRGMLLGTLASRLWYHLAMWGVGLTANVYLTIGLVVYVACFCIVLAILHDDVD